MKLSDNIAKYEQLIGMDKIKETAQLKGKYWMALSPRLLTEDNKMNTDYLIYYWVNYGDDETFGGFTVEQIKKWLTIPGLLLYKLGGTRERSIHNDTM